MSEPELGDPSVVMNVIKQRFARHLHRGRKLASLAQTTLWNVTPEPVWQKRSYDFNVWSERKRIEKLRYIHRNRVKRGLVEQPEQWRWSSYRAYFHGEEGPVFGLTFRSGRWRSRFGRLPCKVSQRAGARSAHSFAKNANEWGTAPAVWLCLRKNGPPAVRGFLLESAPMPCCVLQITPTTLDWIRSLSTLAAVLVALAVTLWGESMRRWFYKPSLQLQALVRRPDAERVTRRSAKKHGAEYSVKWYEAWYFRLVISNLSGTPARDVQVYLKKVEKADRTNVEKFTPMNLTWSNTDAATAALTTRKVLLKDIPVLCDFIHISDPAYKEHNRENLDGVPSPLAVMNLDVEATNSTNGHLLGPGAYVFHLYVVAENSPARHFTVEVRYDGTWYLEQDQMFDQKIGFRMEKL